MKPGPDAATRGERPRRTGGSRAGFTLIEVLAALVVTGLMVAVVLPYATRLATRWWVGEEAIGSADAWMQAVARMSDDLAEAVPFGLGPDAQPMPAFRADPEAITFVRSALGRSDALETVTYRIRSSPGGMALVRSSRPFEAGAFESEASDRDASATLIEGRLRFRLSEIARNGARRADWAPARGMPVAVELSAESDRPQGAPSAPIIMPIAAQAPAVGVNVIPQQ